MRTLGSPNQAEITLAGEGISLSFAGFQVLKEVDFTLQPGKIHAITGENGAGKSSLAKILAGIYRPDSGTIRLNNEPVTLKTPKEAQRHKISLIHQEPLPFATLSVAENIYAGHLPRNFGLVDWKTLRQNATNVLRRLGMDLDPNQPAKDLSIADQQLLELAHVLALESRVLIFDETTAPLTPNETQRLFQVIRSLAQSGCAIGIVSHHMHEVFEISDEITVLRDGAKVAHLQTADSTPAEVIKAMVGRDFDTSTHAPRDQSSAVVLQVENLTGPGFQDISFEVKKGEIFGLAGLVGAGRSEVVRSLFGIAPVESGQATLDGQPVKPNATAQAIKQGIAMVPEDRRASGLFTARPIRENTSITTIKRFLNRARLIQAKQEKQAVEQTLATLKTVMRNVDQPVGNLSGGNQQKVVLGRWLMTDPKLLILDEPTRGVDIGAKADVHARIHALAEKGVAILVISSDLPEVISLCDRVGVMRKGTYVGTLDRSELTEERIMEMAAS